MKILTVIPIAKGVPRDELSYFSARDVRPGTLVTAPFGTRAIQGVVIDIRDVRDLKSSIKSSEFALRNVSDIHTDRELPRGVFEAAQHTARFYLGRPGSILGTMLPKQLFEHYLSHPVESPAAARVRPDIQAIQVPFRDRISTYRTFVRENLARGVSTIIIAPTVVQAERVFARLSPGIEDRIALAHGRRTRKQVESALARVVSSREPVVLVATAPFVTLVRSDWANVVVEQSSSSHYRYDFGPSFDMRHFVERMARWYGAQLTYADTLLSSTVRSRIDRSEIIDARSTWHLEKPESFCVVDTRAPAETAPSATVAVDAKGIPRPVRKEPFRILSRELRDLIETARSRRSQVLLMTTRKGIAPITVCSDCGTAVTCPVCQTPLVLHHRKSKDPADHARVYLCHHCTYTTTPQDRCAACGGWRLTMLGISTEGIRAEVEESFPSLRTFVVDGDTTQTPAAVARTVRDWQATEGSVLIATPMALASVDRAPYGCIVSIDSLLSLPAYTSGEQALLTVATFLERIETAAMLQTRNPDNDVVRAIRAENLLEFMRDELENRTQFGYPPAKVLVKVSYDAPRHEAKEVSTYYETAFRDHDPDIMMKRSAIQDHIVVQAIIRVEASAWDDDESELRAELMALSPSFRKEVNPESVL